jgi:hypothetical protein
MKTLTRVLFFLLLVVAARPARAQSAAGATAFDFLNLDTHARAVALGGAYTALASDANALRYNPAGLASLAAPEATFTHNQFVQGVYQDHLAYAAKSGWGVDVQYLSMGAIPRTTFSQPDGAGSSFGVYW